MLGTIFLAGDMEFLTALNIEFKEGAVDDDKGVKRSISSRISWIKWFMYENVLHSKSS